MIPNKHGQIQLVTIALIVILVGALTAVMLQRIGNQLASGEHAMKKAVAPDIALLLNTAQAIPDDFEIIYSTDLSDFIVQIDDSGVTIHSKSTAVVRNNVVVAPDPNRQVASTVLLGGVQSTIITSPQALKISKSGGTVAVRAHHAIS